MHVLKLKHFFILFIYFILTSILNVFAFYGEAVLISNITFFPRYLVHGGMEPIPSSIYLLALTFPASFIIATLFDLLFKKTSWKERLVIASLSVIFFIWLGNALAHSWVGN